MGARFKRSILLWPLAAALALSPITSSASDSAEAPEWRVLRPGLQMTYLSAESTVRVGSGKVLVIRINPEAYDFRVLAAASGDEGHDAEDWRINTSALAVVNAGQYTPEKEYLGLLVQDGHILSRQASLPAGLFVADPIEPDLPRARVLDLQYTPFDSERNPYRQAAQSLMLLDRFGRIRVRKSPKVAHRTALAEDTEGRILVIITEGAHTLWEFANFLAKSSLKLREVMCMDGGPEAQLDLQVGDFKLSQYGGPSATPDLPLPWPAPSLPVALGIFPRKSLDLTEAPGR